MQYWKVGDILYVREKTFGTAGGIHNQDLCYATHCSCGLSDEEHAKVKGWTPSIHMPKELARIFLKVTDVRVERVQDITSEQAKNEGVDLSSGTPFPKSTARDCHGAKNGLSMYQSKFVILWDSTMKKQDLDKYSWESNPFVWVIEFERVEVANEGN